MQGNNRDDYDPSQDPFDPAEYGPRPGQDGQGPRKFKQVPPARRYPFQIAEWEISDDPGPSGFHYLKIAASIQQPGPFKDFWVWDVLSYSPKSGQRWAALFYALGWTPEHGEIQRDDPAVLSEWLDAGITFLAKTKVEHDPQYGRKAKIAYYIPIDEAQERDQNASTHGSHAPRQDGGQGVPTQEERDQWPDRDPDPRPGGRGIDPFADPGHPDPDDDLPF